MEGWVSLYRKILSNPVVCKDTDYFAIWLFLLLEASHTDQFKMFGGNKITLKRGQLITGRKAISNQFGGKSNLSESKVQRVLKSLEIEQMIEQHTSNKNRLITVLNYDTYQISEQQNEQQLNNKRTTTEQQLNTNNNVIKKELDNLIKEKEPKHKYGEYNHVLLTDSEYSKLDSEFGNVKELIKYLDAWIEEKPTYKAKSHYLSIRRWVVDAVGKKKNGFKPNKPDVKIDWLEKHIDDIKKGESK